MQQVKTSKILGYILLILATVSACNINSKKSHAQTQDEKILKSFPTPAGYVSDFASLFSPTERDSLENIIGNFENSTTVQIAIIIFKA